MKDKVIMENCFFFFFNQKNNHLNFIPEKTKIWAEVERYFTESESCVRSEVQEIDGEDFKVWRWVQPLSPGI